MSIKAYVDASFAVHPDMRSHTGVIITLGKGAIYSRSSKQKLNTKSSTESELVAKSDALPQVLWFQRFARIFRSTSSYMGRQRVDNNVSESGKIV